MAQGKRVTAHEATKQKLKRLIAHKNDEQCQRTTRSCPRPGRLGLSTDGTLFMSMSDSELDVLHASLGVDR